MSEIEPVNHPSPITPDIVQAALKKSDVYKHAGSTEARGVYEDIALRIGTWILEAFPNRTEGTPSVHEAVHEFKTSPMWEATDEEKTPTPRGFFADELNRFPLGLARPKIFLNGLFREMYLQLGGKKLPKLPWE